MHKWCNYVICLSLSTINNNDNDNDGGDDYD